MYPDINISLQMPSRGKILLIDYCNFLSEHLSCLRLLKWTHTFIAFLSLSREFVIVENIRLVRFLDLSPYH